MSEVASAYVSLIPSFKGGQGQIAKELGGAGKSGGAAASKGFKGSFLSGVKSIAGPVAGLIGVSAGIGFLKDSVAEAREAQKVGALTESVIKATGGAAKVSAKQVGDLASAISTKTGIDDETIQSGQNMLLTFKNIRNEAGKGNDIFDQTTKTLVDMSAAMGTDPKRAAIGLGKALNDPIKGVTALSRVGVTFTDQQKEQIKSLVEGGDAMAAQKIILKELNSEFGGAAAASSTAGEKAAVAWGNLKEQIGTAVLPVIDKVAGVFTKDVVPAISKFVKQMQNGKGAGGEFVDILGDAKTVLGQVGDVIQKVAGFLNEHRAAAIALTGAVAALVVVTKVHAAVLAVQAAGGLAAMIKGLPIVTALTKTWAAVQWVLNAALTANPIGIVVVAIAALVAGLILAWKKSETFRNAVKALAIGFLELGKWGVTAFRFLLTAAFNTFDGILSAAEKGLGWIPGLGPKISAAREAFGNFGDATIAKLRGVEDRLTGVQQKIAGIPASKTFTLNIQTIKSASAKNESMLDGVRALGGPVRGGGTYLVGENGPELFTPRTSGAIIPNSDTVAAASAGGGGPRVVRVVIGAREFEGYMDERADSRIDANGRHPIGRRR